MPGHLKSVQIPVASNQTLEAELADELTQALTDRFVRDNTLRVVQKDADSVLESDITGYENRVFGFNSQQQADEYLVTVTVQMTFRDRVKNKEMWSERIQGAERYFVGGGGGQTVNTEAGARALAIKQIVDAAVARTTENW
jgi:hypothetical protein